MSNQKLPVVDSEMDVKGIMVVTVDFLEELKKGTKFILSPDIVSNEHGLTVVSVTVSKTDV